MSGSGRLQRAVYRALLPLASRFDASPSARGLLCGDGVAEDSVAQAVVDAVMGHVRGSSALYVPPPRPLSALAVLRRVARGERVAQLPDAAVGPGAVDVGLSVLRLVNAHLKSAAARSPSVWAPPPAAPLLATAARRTGRSLFLGGLDPPSGASVLSRVRPGALLLAHPSLRAPFERAVVLVLEHDADVGSLGVVINCGSPVGLVMPDSAGSSDSGATTAQSVPSSPLHAVATSLPLHAVATSLPAQPLRAAVQIDYDPDEALHEALRAAPGWEGKRMPAFTRGSGGARRSWGAAAVPNARWRYHASAAAQAQLSDAEVALGKLQSAGVAAAAHEHDSALVVRHAHAHVRVGAGASGAPPGAVKTLAYRCLPLGPGLDAPAPSAIIRDQDEWDAESWLAGAGGYLSRASSVLLSKHDAALARNGGAGGSKGYSESRARACGSGRRRVGVVGAYSLFGGDFGTASLPPTFFESPWTCGPGVAYARPPFGPGDARDAFDASPAAAAAAAAASEHDGADTESDGESSSAVANDSANEGSDDDDSDDDSDNDAALEAREDGGRDDGGDDGAGDDAREPSQGRRREWRRSLSRNEGCTGESVALSATAAEESASSGISPRLASATAHELTSLRRAFGPGAVISPKLSSIVQEAVAAALKEEGGGEEEGLVSSEGSEAGKSRAGRTRGQLRCPTVQRGMWHAKRHDSMLRSELRGFPAGEASSLSPSHEEGSSSANEDIRKPRLWQQMGQATGQRAACVASAQRALAEGFVTVRVGPSGDAYAVLPVGQWHQQGVVGVDASPWVHGAGALALHLEGALADVGAPPPRVLLLGAAAQLPPHVARPLAAALLEAYRSTAATSDAATVEETPPSYVGTHARLPLYNGGPVSGRTFLLRAAPDLPWRGVGRSGRRAVAAAARAGTPSVDSQSAGVTLTLLPPPSPRSGPEGVAITVASGDAPTLREAAGQIARGEARAGDFLLFKGAATWAQGQLAQEIAGGVWLPIAHPSAWDAAVASSGASVARIGAAVAADAASSLTGPELEAGGSGGLRSMLGRALTRAAEEARAQGANDAVWMASLHALGGEHAEIAIRLEQLAHTTPPPLPRTEA